MKYPPIGPISEGTLRPQDLLVCFYSILKKYNKEKGYDEDFLEAIINQLNGGDFEDIIAEIIEEMMDDLNEIAAPYSCFGSQEGDGACFGFWPSLDEELPRFGDYNENTPGKDFTGDAYLVNDHWNITCARFEKGDIVETYWDCV